MDKIKRIYSSVMRPVFYWIGRNPTRIYKLNLKPFRLEEYDVIKSNKEGILVKDYDGNETSFLWEEVIPEKLMYFVILLAFAVMSGVFR